MNLTTIGKVYVATTVIAAGVTSAIFGKAMSDMTGFGKDVAALKNKVSAKFSKKEYDDFFDDDDFEDGDDEEGDVIAMMNAQNSAVTGDPVQ